MANTLTPSLSISSAKSLRVMADTNVIIAGILYPRWFYEFLNHAIVGDFKLVLAAHTLRELEKWQTKSTEAQKQALDSFLAICQYEIAPYPSVEELQNNRDLVRDPNDIPIALAAIQSEVDYLVTNDKDLTVEDETTTKLRQKIQPIIVGKFLKEIMGWDSADLERIRFRKWSDIVE